MASKGCGGGCARGIVTKRHGRSGPQADAVGRDPAAAVALSPPNSGIAKTAASCALVSSFLFGYSICVLDSCGELIPVVFEWCNSDWQSDCLASRVCQALVNASIYIGASAGAFLSGRPRLAAAGSRFQIMVSDILFIVGAALCGAAQGVGFLLLGRLVSGVGLGLSAIAAPVYIAEVSPRERRGSSGAMHGLFIAVGIWCSITFGLPQSPPPMEGEPMVGLDRWYWRLLLGLPMVPAAAQLVLFKWRVTVDPPSFLVNSGQITEARSLLYETYGLQPPVADAPAELGNSAAAKVELILSEMVDACTQARAIPRLHIHQAVCDPFLRCALFLGFALAAFQQLSGINALMSYSNTLFSQAGISDNHLTLASTIMATANVCVSFLSSSVVDHWGRRKLLLLGSLLQAAAMLAITAAGVPGLLFLPSSTLGPLVLFCFSLFVVSFSAGLGAVTWLYLSEIYPMEIRGSALSACGVINWLSCFLVVFGARFLSLHSSCRLFGMVCGFGAVGVYLWVVETKGCNMEDSPLTPRSLRSTSSLLQATPQEDLGGELKMTVERT